MPNMTGVQLLPKALAVDTDLAVIMLTAIDEPRTAIECLKLGAYDYLIKPVDLDELEMSLQSGLRQRQLEIDRRQLEQWLAREVAVRTRDLEERTTVVEDIALAALAAAGDWPGASDAVEKLAKEFGTSPDDVTREIRKRRRAAGDGWGAALCFFSHPPNLPTAREGHIKNKDKRPTAHGEASYG